MNRVLQVCLIALVAIGCASSGQHKVKPLTEILSIETMVKKEKTVYLATETAVQKRIDKFFQGTPNPNERQKINYLIQALRASDFAFIRNGYSYSGDQASKWLRWKMHHRQFRKVPIITVEGFIKRVATRSNNSGLYYQIRIGNLYYNLHVLLENEFKALRKSEVENALDAVLAHELIQEISAKSAEFKVPVIIPPVAAT